MNKRNQWGIVIGKPTNKWEAHLTEYRNSLVPIVGQWLPAGFDGNQPYPALFDTREEARKMAKKLAKTNKYWHYHPRKYLP